MSGVNFTNILRADFSYKSFCAAFMCLQFGFVIFWQNDFGAKAAHKMLLKLTPEGKKLDGLSTKIEQNTFQKKREIVEMNQGTLAERKCSVQLTSSLR